jgi:hypothetical protein
MGLQINRPANIPDRTVSSGTTRSAGAATGSLDRVGLGSSSSPCLLVGNIHQKGVRYFEC